MRIISIFFIIFEKNNVMIYPNTTPYSLVSEALRLFIVKMRPYVADVISKETGGNWAGDFYSKLRPYHQRFWNGWETKSDEDLVNLIDYYNLPTFGIEYKDSLMKEVGNKQFDADRLIFYFRELQKFRNDCNHVKPLKKDAITRAFMNMKDSAGILEMQDLKNGLEELEERINKIIASPVSDKSNFMKDSAKIPEMQDLEKGLKEIEERKNKILESPVSDKSNLKIIQSFKDKDMPGRPQVFGYELKTHGETYFLIFGYRKKFAYCDLIADRVEQTLPKEDRLIREGLFDEKRTPKTQPSYLIKKFPTDATKDYGKDFLDKILKILKEN